MPETARGFGIDPYNVEQSVDAYFRYMIGIYDQLRQKHPHLNDEDVMWLAVAGYNAGPNRDVIQIEGRVPNFEETQNYIAHIKKVLAKTNEWMAADISPIAPAPPSSPESNGEYGTGVMTPTDRGYSVPEFLPTGHRYFNQGQAGIGEVAYTATGNPEQTMSTSGCMPTALAAAISSVRGEAISPLAIAEFSLANNHRTASSGSRWSLVPEFTASVGLGSTQLSLANPAIIDEIKQRTDTGQVLLINGRDTDRSTPATRGGHVFAIRGVTDEGNLLIIDPNSLPKTKVSHAPHTILGPATQLWAIHP
jgi:hypothetical protein